MNHLPVDNSSYTSLDQVRLTGTMRRKEKLHKIYSREQLKALLDFLKIENENLWLCCMLCYGALLRPHEEIRKLKVSHLQKNCTEIHLSGHEHKTAGVRIAYLPSYLSDVLRQHIVGLGEDDNIFSRSKDVHNPTYFHTRWQRLKKKMLAEGLLKPNQSIYSFRHTAAVNVYHKTNDISIVQRLMGHSQLTVTIKYLRSLGEDYGPDLRSYLPEL